MRARDVVRALERDGWAKVSQRGGHLKLRKAGVKNAVIVPMHRGDIRPGTLRMILEAAGISEERFRELLRS